MGRSPNYSKIDHQESERFPNLNVFSAPAVQWISFLKILKEVVLYFQKCLFLSRSIKLFCVYICIYILLPLFSFDYILTTNSSQYFFLSYWQQLLMPGLSWVQWTNILFCFVFSNLLLSWTKHTEILTQSKAMFLPLECVGIGKSMDETFVNSVLGINISYIVFNTWSSN